MRMREVKVKVNYAPRIGVSPKEGSRILGGRQNTEIEVAYLLQEILIIVSSTFIFILKISINKAKKCRCQL